MYLLALGVSPVHSEASLSSVVAPTEGKISLAIKFLLYVKSFNVVEILYLKLQRVFSSCKITPASARIDQLHWPEGGDS